MTSQMFLFLLFAYSILTGLTVEAIKKLIEDKENKPYNIISLVVAVIVGLFGTIIYYQLNGIDINANNMIYAVLLGLASGVCSQVGFDKVKQTLMQIGVIK